MLTITDIKDKGWEEGINQVINCDCLKVMNNIPDKSIDLVLTSPPYNCGIEYGIHKDTMDWKDYYDWCRKWIKEIYRIMKVDGRFCLIHYLSLGQSNNRHAPLMKLNCIAEKIGLKHHGLAIWWDITLTKRSAWGSWLSASSPYINSPFEGILILYKENWKKIEKGFTEISKEEFMECCSGIWKIAPEHNRTHPAPFPKKMASRCIKLLSYEGNTIFDPFAGSFTTAVACKELKRNFICCDIEKKYCEVGEKRLLNVTEGLF